MNPNPTQPVLGLQLIDDAGWIGGTLYLWNLAICLSRLPDERRPQIRLLGSAGAVSKFVQRHGNLPGIASPIRQGLWGRLLRRLGISRRNRPAIDFLYPGFGPDLPGATTIHWIPDFQHRHLPELFSEEEIRQRDRSIREIGDKPGVIVLSSEVAARDYAMFFPEHRATPRVWHFCSLLESGEKPKTNPCVKFSLPQKFLYLPNQFWAHKNHITVLEAIAQLKDEYQIEIPLVCTGAQSDRRNQDHFSRLLAYINEHGLSEQVYLLGLIDRDDQIDVFRHAAAIVQPSLFEGWSTVVEDCRALGRPIFLSDIPVHREQAPDNCRYFPPRSAQALASLLRDQWLAFAPGPDFAAEAQARHLMQERILGSAMAFRKILDDARMLPSGIASEA